MATHRTPGLARAARWTALIALLPLLLPLAAMQFGTAMNWGIEDFVAAAVLLGSGSAAYFAVAGRVRTKGRRGLVAVAAVATVLLVWVELAVGIFH